MQFRPVPVQLRVLGILRLIGSGDQLQIGQRPCRHRDGVFRGLAVVGDCQGLLSRLIGVIAADHALRQGNVLLSAVVVHQRHQYAVHIQRRSFQILALGRPLQPDGIQRSVIDHDHQSFRIRLVLIRNRQGLGADLRLVVSRYRDSLVRQIQRLRLRRVVALVVEQGQLTAGQVQIVLVHQIHGLVRQGLHFDGSQFLFHDLHPELGGLALIRHSENLGTGLRVVKPGDLHVRELLQSLGLLPALSAQTVGHGQCRAVQIQSIPGEIAGLYRRLHGKGGKGPRARRLGHGNLEGILGPAIGDVQGLGSGLRVVKACHHVGGQGDGFAVFTVVYNHNLPAGQIQFLSQGIGRLGGGNHPDGLRGFSQNTDRHQVLILHAVGVGIGGFDHAHALLYRRHHAAVVVQGHGTAQIDAVRHIRRVQFGNGSGVVDQIRDQLRGHVSASLQRQDQIRDLLHPDSPHHIVVPVPHGQGGGGFIARLVGGRDADRGLGLVPADGDAGGEVHAVFLEGEQVLAGNGLAAVSRIGPQDGIAGSDSAEAHDAVFIESAVHVFGGSVQNQRRRNAVHRQIQGGGIRILRLDVLPGDLHAGLPVLRVGGEVQRIRRVRFQGNVRDNRLSLVRGNGHHRVHIGDNRDGGVLLIGEKLIEVHFVHAAVLVDVLRHMVRAGHRQFRRRRLRQEGLVGEGFHAKVIAGLPAVLNRLRVGHSDGGLIPLARVQAHMGLRLPDDVAVVVHLGVLGAEPCAQDHRVGVGGRVIGHIRVFFVRVKEQPAVRAVLLPVLVEVDAIGHMLNGMAVSGPVRHLREGHGELAVSRRFQRHVHVRGVIGRGHGIQQRDGRGGNHGLVRLGRAHIGPHIICAAHQHLPHVLLHGFVLRHRDAALRQVDHPGGGTRRRFLRRQGILIDQHPGVRHIPGIQFLVRRTTGFRHGAVLRQAQGQGVPGFGVTELGGHRQLVAVRGIGFHGDAVHRQRLGAADEGGVDLLIAGQFQLGVLRQVLQNFIGHRQIGPVLGGAVVRQFLFDGVNGIRLGFRRGRTAVCVAPYNRIGLTADFHGQVRLAVVEVLHLHQGVRRGAALGHSHRNAVGPGIHRICVCVVVFRHGNVAGPDLVGPEFQELHAAAQIPVDHILFVPHRRRGGGHIPQVAADAHHALFAGLLVGVEQIPEVTVIGFVLQALRLKEGEVNVPAAKVVGHRDTDGNQHQQEVHAAPDLLLVEAHLHFGQGVSANDRDRFRNKDPCHKVAFQLLFPDGQGTGADDDVEIQHVHGDFRREEPRVHPLDLHIGLIDEFYGSHFQFAFQFKAAGPDGQVHNAQEPQFGARLHDLVYQLLGGQFLRHPRGIVHRDRHIDTRADHRKGRVVGNGVRQIRNREAEGGQIGIGPHLDAVS